MKVELILHVISLLLGISPAGCSGTEDQSQQSKPKLGPDDIPIVVLSQANLYHATRAEIFKRHLYEQTTNQSKIKFKEGHVNLLHEQFHHTGSWTILSIIPQLSDQFGGKAAVFFCEEETRVNLEKLYESLNKYDFSQELFLGHPLRDKEPTIIHHFAFHENPSSFVYPDFAAGFVLSLPLIKSLATRLNENPPAPDFSIDVKHELAMYIWNKGEGHRMKNAEFLCIYPGNKCATEFPSSFPKCGKPVSEDEVVFAVKTCEKFHKERVPIVKETWGQMAKHIEFCSEKEDPSIPTIDLGVPNTERGHCGKTMAILKRFRAMRDSLQKNWLVIVDDDTLLSVHRLYELLACYQVNEPIALGERYGYGVKQESGGYNYITGGGGMVFSRQAVKMITDLDMCQCGANDDPDDMILGMCLKRLGIIITHSPYFHQARPMDYARGFLERQEPVSFHKHWMADPHQIYTTWLAERTHDEL